MEALTWPLTKQGHFCIQPPNKAISFYLRIQMMEILPWNYRGCDSIKLLSSLKEGHELRTPFPARWCLLFPLLPQKKLGTGHFGNWYNMVWTFKRNTQSILNPLVFTLFFLQFRSLRELGLQLCRFQSLAELIYIISGHSVLF